MTDDRFRRATEHAQALHLAFEAAARSATKALQAFGAIVRDYVPRWELVVDDPGAARATSPSGLARQARDIVLHEFWMAAGEPARSPGARWVQVPARRRPIAVTDDRLQHQPHFRQTR